MYAESQVWINDTKMYIDVYEHGYISVWCSVADTPSEFHFMMLTNGTETTSKCSSLSEIYFAKITVI